MQKSKSNEIKIQERMQLLIKNASNNKKCESIYPLQQMKTDLYSIIGTQQDSSNLPIAIYPYGILNIKAKNVDEKTLKQYTQSAMATNNFQQRKTKALALNMISFILFETKNKRYQKLNEDVYLIKEKDIFYYALTGNDYFVEQMLKTNPQQYANAYDELKRDLIYITAKFGHYNCLKLFLIQGFLINHQQRTNSTGLHAAAFYGHENAVKILLQFGASNAIKNTYGNFPSDEANNTDIKDIILSMNEDKISNVLEQAIKNDIGSCITPLIHKKEIIAKRITRMYKANDKWISIFDKYDFLNDYEPCYHGTKFLNLISILNFGLRKPGEKTPDGKVITVQPNHFKLGKEYYGHQNWADAIFVSPSLFYSCDVCFAEFIMSKQEQWVCVMECRVKKDSYIKGTGVGAGTHKPIDDEPQENEYRIKEKAEIFRIADQKEKVLFVTGILFVQKHFLEESRKYDDWVKAGIISSKMTQNKLQKFDFD